MKTYTVNVGFRSWLSPLAIAMAVSAIALAAGLFAQPLQLPTGASERMFARVAAPPPNVRELLSMLGVGSVTWFVLALMFPLMVWSARRVRLRSRLHAAGLVIIGVIVPYVLTMIVEYAVSYRGAPVRPPFTAFALSTLRTGLLPWIVFMLIVTAIEARRRLSAAAIEHERMRSQMLEQRLNTLTGQLQPHFLFNTLQGISTLIHRNADAADEMLAKLSDLLRALLRHRDCAFVTLADEEWYIRTYLEIAQLRFADRLRFSIVISPDVRDASIPLLLLQPIVENALTHGIGTRGSGGEVRVSAISMKSRLVVEVTDDGTGFDGASPIGHGIGLQNTRDRLQVAYGDRHRFVIERENSTGTRVLIDLPFEVGRERTQS